MLNKQRYRHITSLLSLSTILVLGVTFYLEHIQGLQPCPLCLMQRFSIFVFGLLCFVGLCAPTLKRAKTIVISQMMVLCMGLFFAGRQLWLQSLPVDQTPMCMPGLEALVRYFSWDQVLKALFWGTGDCSEVTWRWLGLSMPGWSACYFLSLLSICALLYWAIQKHLKQLGEVT